MTDGGGMDVRAGAGLRGWWWLDVRTNAPEEALRAALQGLEVEASVAPRRASGVVRILARDRSVLARGARAVLAL